MKELSKNIINELSEMMENVEELFKRYNITEDDKLLFREYMSKIEKEDVIRILNRDYFNI